MDVIPYLHFEGTCEEALTHYAHALGAKAQIAMRHRDAPPEFRGDPAKADQVMHSVLLGDHGPVLMAADNMMLEGETGGGTVSLSLSYPDVEKAKAVFAALAEGGKTTMPLAPAFWGGQFGMFTDRFGMDWMIQAGGPDDHAETA